MYKIENVVNELISKRIKLPKKQYLPNDTEIENYEKEINFKFSEEYKYFLKKASDSIYNGIMPLSISHDLDSPNELKIAIKEARKSGLPEDWLPICEDNGDYYCILDDGSVRYWSHDGDTDESWKNLATWIKEVWLDED